MLTYYQTLFRLLSCSYQFFMRAWKCLIFNDSLAASTLYCNVLSSTLLITNHCFGVACFGIIMDYMKLNPTNAKMGPAKHVFVIQMYSNVQKSWAKIYVRAVSLVQGYDPGFGCQRSRVQILDEPTSRLQSYMVLFRFHPARNLLSTA